MIDFLIIRNKVKGLIKREQEEVEVLSGVSLRELLQFLTERGLAGLEFLAGIPGTIGGAISSNAGAFNQGIGDLLAEAFLLDREGKEIQVQKDQIETMQASSVSIMPQGLTEKLTAEQLRDLMTYLLQLPPQ